MNLIRIIENKVEDSPPLPVCDLCGKPRNDRQSYCWACLEATCDDCAAVKSSPCKACREGNDDSQDYLNWYVLERRGR